MALETELGLELKDIAKNVRKIAEKPAEKRDIIIQSADNILPYEIKEKVLKLTNELCYEESFLVDAGLDYVNPNSRLIIASISDYLLRRKDN